MAKKPEDKIQQKLVELELSIKEEEVKRQVPAAPANSSNQLVAPTGQHVQATSAQTEAKMMEMDLLSLGGWGLLILGLVMFFSHIQITNQPPIWWPGLNTGGTIGFLLIPLLVGMSMLFYNYKSRVGQAVTVGSLAAIILMVLAGLRPIFMGGSLLEFVIMCAPISIGGALLAKVHYQRKATQVTPKEPK